MPRTSRWPAANRLLLMSVLLIGLTGCGKRSTSQILDEVPPKQFADEVGTWERSSDKISESDNQRIGRFFERNPDLLSSPEWTGQPEKYVCKDAQSISRFYWFSGSAEIPVWNALEMEGASTRNLSGVGVPGGATE